MFPKQILQSLKGLGGLIVFIIIYSISEHALFFLRKNTILYKWVSFFTGITVDNISPEYHHELLRGNVACWKEIYEYISSFGHPAMPTYVCLISWPCFATLSLYSMARPPTMISRKQQMAKLYQFSSCNLFAFISSYIDVGRCTTISEKKASCWNAFG